MPRRTTYNFELIGKLESGTDDKILSRMEIAGKLRIEYKTMIGWLSRNCTRTVKVEYKMKGK